jgi:hypothetical protein
MTEHSNHGPAMTQYLLGSLPEAEAERLDELSIIDPEFAAALSVAERDLIDSYVHGELEGSALAQFRSHYLASPLRRERVEFAEALQIFVEKNSAAVVESDRTDRNAKHDRVRWFPALSLFKQRWAWQWSLAAATVLLLIAAGWLGIENLRLRQHALQAEARRTELLQREQALEKEVAAQHTANSDSEQELARLRGERERLDQELAKAKSGGTVEPARSEATVALVLAPPLRGTAQIPNVSLRSGTGFVSIQLQLEAADYPAYRIALIDPAGSHTLWRSGDLKARGKSSAKVIGVKFGAALLKRQNYILRVTGIPESGGAEIVSDYAFRVSR